MLAADLMIMALWSLSLESHLPTKTVNVACQNGSALFIMELLSIYNECAKWHYCSPLVFALSFFLVVYTFPQDLRIFLQFSSFLFVFLDKVGKKIVLFFI